MFRATMCSSSEELSVAMRHWYLSLYGWLSDQLVGMGQSDKYQCRIDILSYPDDGHTVARNM